MPWTAPDDETLKKNKQYWDRFRVPKPGVARSDGATSTEVQPPTARECSPTSDSDESESGASIFRPPPPPTRQDESSDGESEPADALPAYPSVASDDADGAVAPGGSDHDMGNGEDESEDSYDSDTSMAGTAVPSWVEASPSKKSEYSYFSDGEAKRPETVLQRKLDRSKEDLSPRNETDSAEDGDSSSNGMSHLVLCW